jgi:outer membrane protein
MKTRVAGVVLTAAWAAAQTPAGVPVTIDLPGALQRAREFSQQYLLAQTAMGLAREDRIQAKAAFYPTVNAVSQYIYTQGNGMGSWVYVSNDGVHVYNDQALVHADLFSAAKKADYQRTIAAEAAARARQDIAGRGLVATVVQDYYTVVLAQRHEANARRSVEEARQFLEITQKQERGGEVARADVVKAQLQYQQRQRDLLDAETAAQRSRIALGVMLFPDPMQPFNVSDDLRADLPLQAMDELRGLAVTANPELAAGEAGIKQATAGISMAKAAYYPTLAVDYFYGINANNVAVYGPEGQRNLGSSVVGTLSIPVWNWGATRSRVRQAELVRLQAQFDLTYAQRTLQSNLNSFYVEAQAARAQLGSLGSSVDLATESLRLTLLRYQAGEAAALEVVDAQSTLATARNAFDDGLTRYRLGLANLQILTGRL